MHGGLMTVDGQKMSKSLNNFLLLADALKRYGAAPIRFAVARAHYRAAIDLTNAWLREPLNSLLDFHRLFARVPTERCVLDQECLGDPFIKNLVEQFETAMDSDFNTPEAVVALEKARAAIVDDIEKQKLTSDQAMPEMITKRVAVLRELGTILGVFFESLEEVENEGLRLVAHSLGVQALTPDEICAAMRERAEVRAQRDFKRSDEIRAQLATRGVELLDSKAGSTWRFV
jgi:cysteinyl-tRNA synthetase